MFMVHITNVAVVMPHHERVECGPRTIEAGKVEAVVLVQPAGSFLLPDAGMRPMPHEDMIEEKWREVCFVG